MFQKKRAIVFHRKFLSVCNLFLRSASLTYQWSNEQPGSLCLSVPPSMQIANQLSRAYSSGGERAMGLGLTDNGLYKTRTRRRPNG
jgi:hypothetical protein